MKKNNEEIVFSIEGKSYKPYIFILVTMLMTLMQVLSSSGNDTSQAIVTLYFSIVLLTVTIYKIGLLGVVAAGLSSAIFSLIIDQNILSLLVVVGANMAQALLVYLAFKKINFSENNRFFIKIDKLLAAVCGVVYILGSLSSKDNYLLLTVVIFAVLVCIYFVGAIKNKDKELFLFFAFVVFIPNAVGAILGAFQDGFRIDSVYSGNLCRWFFSNAILMMSFGYPIFMLLKKKRIINISENHIDVKFSTILFFGATLLWNIIILSLYYIGWLNNNINSYVFPWFVGNLFFVSNLFFSIFPETDTIKTDSFKWYEHRAVVAENNTQMLVAIISFLLPICAQLLGTITYSISILFIFNITCAIVSIGLIWIPKDYVKYMSAIKHLKTVFHLFTLSLLLLNIVFIINESVMKIG